MYYFEVFKKISLYVSYFFLLMSPFLILGLQGAPIADNIFYIHAAVTVFAIVSYAFIGYGINKNYRPRASLWASAATIILYPWSFSISAPEAGLINSVTILITIPAILYIIGWVYKCIDKKTT